MEITSVTEQRTSVTPAIAMNNGDIAVVTSVGDDTNLKVLVGMFLVRHYRGFTGFKAGESAPRYWNADDMKDHVLVRSLLPTESLTLKG